MTFAGVLDKSCFLKFTGSMSEVFVTIGKLPVSKHNKRKISEVNSMKKESLMTIPELMDFLQVKRNTIYTLRNLGLPTVKIGRSVRFRADSVIRWLSDLEKTSNSPVSGLIHDNAHLL